LHFSHAKQHGRATGFQAFLSLYEAEQEKATGISKKFSSVTKGGGSSGP
jgi:hypothetical protein